MDSITFRFLKVREAVQNEMSQNSWKSPKRGRGGGGEAAPTIKSPDYFEMRVGGRGP